MKLELSIEDLERIHRGLMYEAQYEAKESGRSKRRSYGDPAEHEERYKAALALAERIEKVTAEAKRTVVMAVEVGP